MSRSEITENKEHIGRQLRERRQQKKLSLQALSERSNVSVSMISRIERGTSSPSASILSRLVNELDLSFSTLMAPAISADAVVLKNGEHPELRDPHSDFVRTCLSPILPAGGIDMVKASLPPFGNSGELIAHHRDVEEYVYVLRGCIEVILGDSRYSLNCGDSMFYKANRSHEFMNPAEEPCEFIIVVHGKG